ncbi:MAG TPA: cadherin-like beta sandwich domain-containing protein [Nitrospira sp.]|nr:cadherin-like beta sandwich domain-containing protein [Nitrospira sp.]
MSMVIQTQVGHGFHQGYKGVKSMMLSTLRRRVAQQISILSLAWCLVVLTGCPSSDNPVPTPAPSPGPSLPTLSGLTLSAGTLSPSFLSSTTSYDVTYTGPTSITVTPTATSSTTITVNGAPLTSGTASGSITLPIGNTTIIIAVMDSGLTQSYTITAHVASPPSLPTLSGLTLSAGTLSPSFFSSTTSYDVTYTSPTSITVTPTTASGTTITVNGTAVISGTASGSISLLIGNTTITVAVTSSGGTQSYTITAHVVPLPTLSGLALSAGLLNPPFDPAGTTYSTMYIGDTSVAVTPTAASGTITVNGIPVTSGNASGPINLPSGNTTITVAVTGTGGTTTYTIIAHRLAQQAYGKASNTGLADQFGYSVAVDGDTLAVGANREDSNGTGVNGVGEANDSATDAGAVYVFRRSGSTWAQEAYVKASNAGSDDLFGYSVALSGDTLAVGAVHEQSNGTGVNGGAEADDSASASVCNFGDCVAAGAVYVFRRSSSTTTSIWAQEAYVKASNTGASDGFGYSVALSGNTLAVGAYLEDSNAMGINGDQADNSKSDSGAVYVFTRNGSTWTQEAYVKASNTGSGDWFGRSVTLSGNTLAVGAPREGSLATGVNGNQTHLQALECGAVYVFRRSGNTWTQEAYVKASNTDENDWFGDSVALSGDTLAVGAWQEDSDATGINNANQGNAPAPSPGYQAGAAYVFIRSGTTWTQQAYVKASNTDSGDRFGRSVALSGDTLAVGAREGSGATGINGDQSNNSFFTRSGAVYLYTRSGSTWTQQAYVKASNTGSDDLFGYSVALSGDTLAVGAVHEESNGTGVDGGAEADNSASVPGVGAAGAVYVFQ